MMVLKEMLLLTVVVTMLLLLLTMMPTMKSPLHVVVLAVHGVNHRNEGYYSQDNACGVQKDTERRSCCGHFPVTLIT